MRQVNIDGCRKKRNATALRLPINRTVLARMDPMNNRWIRWESLCRSKNLLSGSGTPDQLCIPLPCAMWVQAWFRGTDGAEKLLRRSELMRACPLSFTFTLVRKSLMIGRSWTPWAAFPNGWCFIQICWLTCTRVLRTPPCVIHFRKRPFVTHHECA